MRLSTFAVACAFLSISLNAYAVQQVPIATEIPLFGVTGYSDDIPKPEDVIGHQIGDAHTMPHQVVEYFEEIAAISDRVVLHEHARSYEHRPLIHAIVTSPANHARLDAIREANLTLSDTPNAVSDSQLEDMPAIIYQGYSVHGNEASGTEAGVLYLYHLAAGIGTELEETLDDVVIILDPMFNPDGRDRFTDWANRNRGGVATTDSQDREHNEAWPGGRTNHYWFDLNRDWLPIQHPESRGRIGVFHNWRPQVLTDHHEMGSNSTFFFQPGIPSRTNPNTPARNQFLTAEIATYHAAILDEVGQLYYSEESFDDFYYGKGSTFPDVNGAIGILFEQASSRALRRSSDHGILEYATTARNQFLTSLSTLEAAKNMRTKLLQHQRDFYREAAEFADSYPVKGYVISLDRGRTRAQLMAEIYQQHRVRVHELQRDVQIDGRTYRAGNAFLIPMNQPQAKFIKATMERETTFQDSLFYDVSAWTMPLAFDLDYSEVRQNIDNLIGAELPTITADGGMVQGGQSSYAYLLTWDRYFAPRAVYRLQQEGVRVSIMNEPFDAVVASQSRSFPRGTLVIPVTQQDVEANELRELIERVAQEDHVNLFAVETGLTPRGPDLGGASSEVIDKPAIALLTGPGSSAYNAGEVWHLLSERFQIPVSLLDVEDTQSADLSRYNTIVMAGGFYGGLAVDKIKAWIRSGGRFIGITSGADWALRNDILELEERELDLDSLLADVPFADLNEARGAQVIGGTIFEAELDTTHPLAYGMSQTIPIFRNRSSMHDPSDRPGANVGLLTEEPLMSGYISEERLADAEGSAALIATRFGGGRVMLFMDNPNFRAFWYGTNRLFLNAVFFGGVY